ncbi:MAG: family 20 glycosylhydrolase [Oscillospiraceae bacterium]|nr:family 20 glycosylhydrolase [Oscillospiraceae bacterium]
MDIKKLVFDLVGCKWDGPVEEIATSDLIVKFDGKTAVIGSSSIPAKARGYMLLAKAISEGKTLDICQKAAFKLIGVMLDVSRGGVMKVSSVKKYIDYMVAHGMNMLMLYAEDVYEVEGYPYFGYQRGRYTLKELQEIDDYADALGVEVIPCIQTFGHMEQFLRYPSSSAVKDSDSVLLAGEEKTYELIEACIATCRKAFRSNRLHIGCDETRGLGLGEYLTRNGYRDRFNIFNEHIQRVTEICTKYNYRPMMWSDMYFTLVNAHGVKDYDPSLIVPQYAIDAMPDCDMCFWDYYNFDNDFYRINIEKHKTFNRPVVFAGGIWTMDGMVPYHEHTHDTMIPAMEECLRGGVDELIITSWSNDGTETSHMLGLPMLSLFSEYCWLGEKCTQEDIWSISQFMTGMTKELSDAVSAFNWKYEGAVRAGKHIMWSDPLINLLFQDFDMDMGVKMMNDAMKVFEKYPDHPDVPYFKAVFQCCLDKCYIQMNLQAKYKAGDKEWLKNFAENEIPVMIANFDKLSKLHHASWHADYKTHGYERIMCRYAATKERLKYTAEVIGKYLNGELSEIEELEPEVLHDGIHKWFSARHFMYIESH